MECLLFASILENKLTKAVSGLAQNSSNNKVTNTGWSAMMQKKDQDQRDEYVLNMCVCI